MEGAVERVRPKMMTVMAILMGLLPIMWSTARMVGSRIPAAACNEILGNERRSSLVAWGQSLARIERAGQRLGGAGHLTGTFLQG
jgi:hypothetical protein